MGARDRKGGRFFEEFTSTRYNAAIRRALSHRKLRITLLILFALIGGVVFWGASPIQNSTDVILLILKAVWLIPIPLLALYLIGLFSFTEKDFTLSVADFSLAAEELAKKQILYTITTRGWNIECVDDSASSVLYWIEQVSSKYRLTFKSEVWIVVEEDAYLNGKMRYDALEKRGVKVLAIPSDYQTRNHTRFKARALQYATEQRGKLGFNTQNDWVYHQDEETQVGEDTIFGNLDFILKSSEERIYGAGIILYPLSWKNSVPSAEESARSSLYDFLYMYPMRNGRNTAAGYHGSHFIMRADVEEEIGWDFGPKILTEDGVFAARILNSKPRAMQVMKGFAYEQPPFTTGDLLRQRRRWILGALTNLTRSELKRGVKFPILGGLVVWFSALWVMVGIFFSLILPSRGQFPGAGILLGLLLYFVCDIYSTGYLLNSAYFQQRLQTQGKFKLALNSLLGLISDSLAPWYAILRRTSTYETVAKQTK